MTKKIDTEKFYPLVIKISEYVEKNGGSIEGRKIRESFSAGTLGETFFIIEKELKKNRNKLKDDPEISEDYFYVLKIIKGAYGGGRWKKYFLLGLIIVFCVPAIYCYLL